MSKLKDGNIPAGQPCPFLKDCSFKTANCPGYTLPGLSKYPRLNPKDYSCAAARAWDMAGLLPKQEPSQG